MKALIVAALMMALLPLAAYAQGAPPRGPATVRTEAEKKRDAEIDRAYKEALKRDASVKQPPPDPWQTIRPAPTDTTKH